jgi:hypothetical protein
MKAIFSQMMSKMLSLHNKKKDEGITLNIRKAEEIHGDLFSCRLKEVNQRCL